MNDNSGPAGRADMGERLSGDGVPGRHHAQPGGAVSDSWDVRDVATLETALAAAIRQADLDPQAERRAVAAFRAARAANPHRARTRRRDDWRVPEERRARRPVKTTFGVVVASLALGGVAVAAIDSVSSRSDRTGGDQGAARPSAAAPDRPGDAATSTSSGGSRPTGRPAPARDTEAHCRAYKQVQGHGRTLDAKAWQRLVAAAGGEDEVAAYCSEQLRRATAAPGKSAGTGKSGKGAAGTGNGTSDSKSGGTDKAADKGRASGQGGGKHS
ncbi:hypothetical protein [Streptomyces alanosinicus]|uniref:Uncharacterized protein n=1 Tax=Streptomyces alanosinicus TaxID=68171 RepID=A0A919D4R6_9ACTN|nr:hypothetical protein [Streptomyces alanosinicus]GHE08165.1 hypothetical protein GCM10010339_55470 [Streptomyces alanosinicus]